MIHLRLLTAICLLLLGSGAASAGELHLRQDIIDRVHAMVDARDFAGLDAMERDYLATRSRTPSGTWKLDLFHSAVRALLPMSDATNGCAFTAEPVLKEWAAGSPNSPTPHVAMAYKLVERAWCFRGPGYAKDVGEDSWTPFHENIDAAEAVLNKHKRVASLDPEYYVVMEDIYRADGRDDAEFRKLLREATAKQPYYYGIYWHAYFYYQPQWFGGDREIDEAARYAVERTRSADGLGAYARYYWYASSLDCDCWIRAIDWPVMKQAMGDVARRYPVPWNLANFAKLACRMSDSDTARLYFTALGENDGSEAWPNDIAGWKYCRTFSGLGDQSTFAPPASR